MPPTKPNLTQDERDEIVQYLVDRARNVPAEDGSVARTLPKGMMTATATKFNVSRKTVFRVWKRAKENFAAKRVMKSVSKIDFEWLQFNDVQLEKAFWKLQTVFEEVIK